MFHFQNVHDVHFSPSLIVGTEWISTCKSSDEIGCLLNLLMLIKCIRLLLFHWPEYIYTDNNSLIQGNIWKNLFHLLLLLLVLLLCSTSSFRMNRHNINISVSHQNFCSTVKKGHWEWMDRHTNTQTFSLIHWLFVALSS